MELATVEALDLAGADMDVPLVGGGTARAVNFDFAASSPALAAVDDAVRAFLPWYSSVHRGAGYKSMVSTAAYEQARVDVARFVGARDDDVVVFTRNTTDSLNVLSAALPDDCRVVTFLGEHHADLLPWRRHEVQHLPIPPDPTELAGVLDDALSALGPGPALFAVTAVSNVTGECWPVAELAAVARRHGARVVVDAAQLAPHGPVELAAWEVDWVALSGHKMYAPYGVGALVGRRDWLEQREPFLAGGGAVAFVTDDDVLWADAPERQEAGSPNVVGAVALGAACQALADHGMDRVLAHERHLDRRMRAGLETVPGLRRHHVWGDDHPRIAVATFTLPGMHHSLVAAILSAEYGIAVRDGCFCAHPLMVRLMDVDPADVPRISAEVAAGNHANVPGATRASAGLTTTDDDVDRLVDALGRIALDGPTWTYDQDPVTGNWSPCPDDRPLPDLGCLPPT
ncbi:aminotransferase class V-fold PLP-dependent enzyme [Salsipaludibacter albus]|uniref:aminotransferase class V-fold PLP-dependent enzyme n=1 Tax=Salsipaludibacter albus TaxID=2849650 RepID=UPI001EE4643A|nr:aminotransferase class V-fold PLP-dependent enzyme [Salsipaludibacter albus]MBY5162144.1 aminotransferase class V-fold PLP-dependent enzyme [Salsipaludibacter albus]